MTEGAPGYRGSRSPALERGALVAGAYTVRDEVARDETGVVFEARDMLLDRLVALKVAWRDPATPSMILDARRLSLVRDPCAVAVYGMGRHDGAELVIAERVTGALLATTLDAPLPTERYLTILRAVFAAVARAHDAGLALGEVSASTVAHDPASHRIVLGQLSLAQVPSLGPLGRIFAPEVLHGDASPLEPQAGPPIDLYNLGCLALELATGRRPFASSDHASELRGHAHEPPPRLGELRPDLPADLSDLVEWLLAKVPTSRPASAAEALAQLDAVTTREHKHGRAIRILVVDDDTARARWTASLARRAHAGALVEVSSEGTDAAHKLNRDHPDLVFVTAQLGGVMNALELCMYARGLESDPRAHLVIVGAVSERDRALFADPHVTFTPNDAHLARAILERVRTTATTPARRQRPRKTISG